MFWETVKNETQRKRNENETEMKRKRVLGQIKRRYHCMFDKLPYFGHISSKGPTLDVGLYTILLLIEVLWFITMT